MILRKILSDSGTKILEFKSNDLGYAVKELSTISGRPEGEIIKAGLELLEVQCNQEVS